ncbi:CMRF35-like molecule 6 [Alligator mississippiensis]|uniref:CMRF35-like molecule 6 n=1 Tax=Alligator mississippiensis TaxID=8496 RepID=UPI002877A70E|nr:CMRF35-like molecule 6 [Alligator mississippiensis]
MLHHFLCICIEAFSQGRTVADRGGNCKLEKQSQAHFQLSSKAASPRAAAKRADSAAEGPGPCGRSLFGSGFSSPDNHILRTFTITMEHLTKADAGTYLCGVLIAFSSDLRHAVEVTVSPVLSSMEPPVSTEFTASIFTWRISTESQVSSFPAVHNMSQSSQDSHVHFLLLVGLKVPVFLCMVCAVVWVSVCYRGSSND